MLLSRVRAAGLAPLIPLLAPTVAAQEATPGVPVELQQPGTSPLIGEFEPGSGSVTFQIGVHDHSDSPGDGNPFLDETLTVLEPVVIYDYDVSDDFGIGVELSYDYVSSASIDRLSKFPEQSGASRDNYLGGDVRFRHRVGDDARLGWHLGYSDEYDYDSIGLGASYQWQPRDKDGTVQVSLDGYYDSITIIRFDGTEEGDDERISLTGQVRWYQIFSPRTHGELGALIAHQSGFLETPYNAVVIEDPTAPPNPNLHNMARGFEITEELPDTRVRAAVFGTVKHRTSPGRAWGLSGRLYGDSWDVFSATVSPSFHQTLGDDGPILDLRYRFYVQTAAADFEESFGLPDQTLEHRTQDSDLGDFTTNSLGVGLRWEPAPHHALRLDVDYALRSDGLDYVYGSVGWTWSF